MDVKVVNLTSAVVVSLDAVAVAPTTSVIVRVRTGTPTLSATFPASTGWLAAAPQVVNMLAESVAPWTYACCAYAYMTWANVTVSISSDTPPVTLTVSPVIDLTLMMGAPSFGYANAARGACSVALDCAPGATCAPAPTCVYDRDLMRALPLLPYSPFSIQRLTGGSAPVVAHLGTLPSSCSTSGTCTGALQFEATFPPMPLMFVPRPNGGPGYTLFQPADTTSLNSQAVTFADATLPAGQLTVMLFNGTSKVAGNTAGPRTHSVLLFLPDVGGYTDAYVLAYTSCGTAACSVYFTPASGVLDFTTCIGFATPVSAPTDTPMACMLVIAPAETACALRTSAAYNCWDVARAGCPWGQTACTARDTEPGITLCSSTCSNEAVALDQARDFITGVCAARFVPALDGSTCRSIAGAPTPPAACSGWTTDAFAAACAAACTASSSLDCDAYKTHYCQQNSSDPDCACLAVDTNPLRVPTQNNLSFPEYTCALRARGMNQATALLPQCWWPTCALTSNAILTSSFNKVSEPTAYSAMCPNSYTRCIVAAQDISSKVSVIVNEYCPQQKNNTPPINCPSTTADTPTSLTSTMPSAAVADTPSQPGTNTATLGAAQKQLLMAIGAHALGATTNYATQDTPLPLAGAHLATRTTQTTTQKHRLSSAQIGYIIGGCVGGALALVLIAVITTHFMKRKRTSVTR